MLRQIVCNLLEPAPNSFPTNKALYSKDYSVVREETSLFENILSTMKSSKQIKTFGCSNPNCKVALANFSNCSNCCKKFCDKCMMNCSNCNRIFCKFCLDIRYERYEDVLLCPNCSMYYVSQ